ncbi:MAG: 50S ribosomal protein L15 [Anaerolineae bacterium]|nr:50S ribosomal protein L15 [Anaerolineae bacterium]
MKLHDLQPAAGSKRKRRRVARGHGAGQGTHAGRGIKGQHSRGSGKIAGYFEGGQLPLVRRLPFKRGFNNIFRVPYQEVRLDRLVNVVEDGALVTPALMAEKGLIDDARKAVVILGNGDAIKKKLTVHAHRFTKSAVEKITAAGGSTQTLEVKVKGIRGTFRKLRKVDLAKIYGDE